MAQPMTQVAALKFAGSAPARLLCPTADVRVADSTTVLPWRHSKSTTPRSVTGGWPCTGFRSNVAPPWRAEAPLPTATKLALAPLATSSHCLCAFKYCRRKLMYIFWLAWLSPGIEPRMPTVFGSSAGSHTSIVAHSSCELNSARSRSAGFEVFVEPGVDADAGAVASAASAVASASSAADRRDLAHAVVATEGRCVLTI
jgi:hypothetical protein